MSNKPDLGAMYGSSKVETFLGLPPCTDLDHISAKIALLGALSATPYQSSTHGTIGAYCRNAPDVLRAAVAPYAANLDHYDFDLDGVLLSSANLVADCGNIPFNESDFPLNREVIRSAVRKLIDRQVVPVILGGDDSVPIPIFQAYEGEEKYTVVQIDAHIDWRDEVMGERLGLSSTMRRASEMAHIDHIVQVGARGLSSAREPDYRDAVDWGVKFFTGYEIHKNGVQPALEAIPAGSNIILSIDCDALDPSIVPGVIGRSPGGLTYFQIVDLIVGAAHRGKIAGVTFVEFMPERDVDGIGALNLGRIVISTLGVLSRQLDGTYSR